MSGPLLDRFEIQVEVPALAPGDLTEATFGERSEMVAERVAAARRSARDGPAPPLRPRSGRLLHEAIHSLGLSARAHDAVRRVASTISCLEGDTAIEPRHVAEALQYRALDRPLPGGESPE